MNQTSTQTESSWRQNLAIDDMVIVLCVNDRARGTKDHLTMSEMEVTDIAQKDSLSGSVNAAELDGKMWIDLSTGEAVAVANGKKRYISPDEMALLGRYYKIYETTAEAETALAAIQDIFNAEEAVHLLVKKCATLSQRVRDSYYDITSTTTIGAAPALNYKDMIAGIKKKSDALQSLLKQDEDDC